MLWPTYNLSMNHFIHHSHKALHEGPGKEVEYCTQLKLQQDFLQAKALPNLESGQGSRANTPTLAKLPWGLLMILCGQGLGYFCLMQDAATSYTQAYCFSFDSESQAAAYSGW